MDDQHNRHNAYQIAKQPLILIIKTFFYIVMAKETFICIQIHTKREVHGFMKILDIDGGP